MRKIKRPSFPTIPKMPRLPRLQLKKRPAPGSMPGELRLDPEAPRPVMRIIAYREEELAEKEIEDPREIHDFLGRWPVTWINIDGLGDLDVLRRVADIFGLHRLALEDVVNLGQRSKVEDYEDHLFAVTRMVSVNDRHLTEQISLFVGKNYVLTFQERQGDNFDPVRERIRNGKGIVRKMGPDYLAYALIDAVVDHYFPLLERYDEILEELETEVLERPTQSTIARIHEVKRELRLLLRIVRPMRGAIETLLKDEDLPVVTEATQTYLRDCYDHIVRVIDMAAAFSDHARDLMDLYMTTASNRMNEVMKVLTVIASIFIPLTFIAGIYGMNFDTEVSRWNMPELKQPWGYPAALGAMAAIALGMLYFFKRRRWL